MNSLPSRRNAGFTLIELLVVILIIAILAGAGFQAGIAALQKAKKTTALATCVALEQAVNNFYTEYGAMPISGTPTGDVTYNTQADLDFVKILLGKEDTPTLNTRSIRFLNAKDGKLLDESKNKGVNGLVYNKAGDKPIGLFDPWGGPYYVTLDGGYVESVAPAPKAGGGAKLNGRRAAAWSNGADGVSATGKTTDDVKTW